MRAHRGTPTISTAHRIWAVLACILLFAGACTDKNAPKARYAGGAARGTLRVGFAGDDYDNEVRRNVGVTPLNAGILEGLIRLKPDLTLEPLLAQSWEFIAPNTWRFHIRPGVKFQDGKPLNAAAVKTGLFDRVVDSPSGGQLRAGDKSAVVVDDMTIDFTSTITNLRVPEMLAHPSRVVYSPGTDPATPVGTGPFKFVEYKKGEKLVVERNPDYWGTKAAADRIEFTFFPTSTARVEALETGRIDVAFPVPNQDVARLEEEGLKTTKTPVGSDVAIYASAAGIQPYELLTDANLRKAVALSIDRKKVVASLGGDATDSPTHVPSALLGPHAAEIKGIGYDPKQARTILDAAGWKVGADGIREKDGRKLELTLVSGYPSADANKPVPTTVKSQLKAVGVGLKVVEAASLTDYATHLADGVGDLFLEQGTQSDADPAFLPLLIYDWPPAGAYKDLFNPGDAYNAAITRALTSADPNEVKASTAAGLKVAIEDAATVIPLVGLPRVYAFAPGVKGLQAHPSYFSARWDQATFAGNK